ncbi:hypothetical protein PPYR_01647 [Photinus pyralis]|uniref:DDE Tnp4 domain-containing protein n=1 Tax=Photinus pyralis TaxID=7054 RepID=A0A5N4ABD6_PHOPY|nr:putative nuclease HARBI1 isoform X2 [Photinus pyralis]XP_031352195.1 putative nuclease HARBI1 isoform X2 [Photinus pyralis]KAB0794568.1 hypothetical protein PPYR_11407 [Photinus pyralis]KAB0804677.1 hypothetical protein PPYR_01647 [Photinus pyralis]
MSNKDSIIHSTILGTSRKRATAALLAFWTSVVDSDDDDDNVIVSQQLLTTREHGESKRVCIKNYVAIVESYSLDGIVDFRKHFRLTKMSFEEVLIKIGDKLSMASSVHHTGRPGNDAKTQLLVGLWILANQESYRTVADRFDLTISTAWCYFRKVVDTLVSIASDVIQWPKNESQRQCFSTEFRKRQGFPNVIGAIDGTHIPIVAPHNMANSYINRNKYYSIVLQGVCNARYKFIDCYAGPPGSVHDARVLKMSPLGKKLNHNIHDLVPSDYHLLGDSAYSNASHLLTPYKDNGHLSRKQKNYNYKHSATRVAIEQAYGLLKGRFRILRYVNIYDTKVIPSVIISCCVLHNICVDANDVDVEPYQEDADANVAVGINDRNLDTKGRIKRDDIAEIIN